MVWAWRHSLTWNSDQTTDKKRVDNPFIFFIVQVFLRASSQLAHNHFTTSAQHVKP